MGGRRGAVGGGAGAQVFQAALAVGAGVEVDRVGEVVPFLAVQACGVRAEDVGVCAVVVAPVVADCGDQFEVGVLFILVVLAEGGDLLYPGFGQRLAGEVGGQSAPCEARGERCAGKRAEPRGSRRVGC
ncbi:hypothetical protein ACIF8T_39635 [Streptomyces sp. NPDC085946]|uniref:hypothetical protein n=1 Tax=Streptomyces sp. NPDC085946 TaxID=3365744 RepID=UPI0037D76B43